MTEEHGAHPDIETLDAYLDAHLDAHPDAHLDAHPGLSDPGRSRGAVASRADRHIRACATCQETLAALRRVRGELARLATMTMPDEVAERIHAALAARSGTAAGRADGGSPLDAFGAAATHRDHDHEHEHEYGEYGEYGEQGDRRAAGLWRGPGGGSPARFRGAGTGGPRGRRGRPGSPGRAARDWVSIAATCLALVAFGAAVLAVRGLTAGGAGSADATASSPVAASAPPGGDIVVRPDSAAAPTAAGTRSLSVPPGGTSVLVADSDMILRPSDVVPHGQELLAGRLAPTWFGWSDADPDAGSWLAPGTDSMEQPAEAAGRFREQVTAPESVLRAVGTTQLRMCYDSLAAQAGGTVLALDRVRFDGQEAILLVISLPGQGNAARLVVIDAHCGVVPVSSAVLYSVNASRA